MSRTRWRIRATVLLLAVLVGLGAVGLRPAWANPPQHAERHLTVATYNLYLGADLTPLFLASSPQDLVQRAGQIYANVVQTDFPSRAEAIAKLLAANPPDVAGLQEVSLWETGPIGGPLSPSYDFLELLLAALARYGLTYRPVAVNVNFTSDPTPIGATTAARLTDRDVIIARTDLPSSRLKVSNPESHNFAATLVIPSAIPGLSFRVPRGWSAVDVKLRGKTVRFVNTHLEAFSVAVRNQQAWELAAALAGSADPVVLVGDLNSEPDDTAGAYGIFAAAGYGDAWVVHGPEGGFTAGQTELLDNVPSKLDHRIDYVLYQPRGVEAVAAEVIGEELDDRTPTGLWPSDHAGVVATLHLAHP
jgi:endonuclease/exonuclease/phosphatase (EEP) superfamily protein YafD